MTSLQIKRFHFLFLCDNTVIAEQYLFYNYNWIRLLLLFYLVLHNWDIE